ncbi:VOC family protein [Flavobacterium sp.]|uniref:VOC family protein n=1 Tax=Flavobacterium sp. TaxID=239 RepID=UPI003750E0BA
MTFRYARHTNNLENLKSFYTNVLGLELLGGFENHNGYDGVFIGKPDENWHLEFTQSNKIVNHTFDEDDVLVFYPNSKLEYELLLEKIHKYSIEFIKAKNPFWNDPEVSGGKMFLDPDGYRIVISHLKI